jgi:hypothetical protein
VEFSFPQAKGHNEKDMAAKGLRMKCKCMTVVHHLLSNPYGRLLTTGSTHSPTWCMANYGNGSQVAV